MVCFVCTLCMSIGSIALSVFLLASQSLCLFFIALTAEPVDGVPSSRSRLSIPVSRGLVCSLVCL
jgi:hypothetical protein